MKRMVTLLESSRAFIPLSILILSMNIAFATPPMPQQPQFSSFRVDDSGNFLAVLSHVGIYRRAGQQAWGRVLLNPSVGWGYRFIPDGKDLLLTNFEGEIFRSRDAGLNWIADGMSQRLPAFERLDSETRERSRAVTAGGTGYVYIDGVIMSSRNGGKTWHELAKIDGAKKGPGLFQGLAANDDLIYGVVDNVLYRSLDHGAHWNAVPQENPEISPISTRTALSIRLMPGGALYVGGWSDGGPKIFYSADGGATWKREYFGLAPDRGLFLKSFGDDGDVLYLYIRPDASAKVAEQLAYRSVGGRDATRINFDVGNVLAIMQGKDGVMYLIGQEGENVYSSIDQGASWKAVTRTGISW